MDAHQPKSGEMIDKALAGLGTHVQAVSLADIAWASAWAALALAQAQRESNDIQAMRP